MQNHYQGFDPCYFGFCVVWTCYISIWSKDRRSEGVWYEIIVFFSS